MQSIIREQNIKNYNFRIILTLILSKATTAQSESHSSTVENEDMNRVKRALILPSTETPPTISEGEPKNEPPFCQQLQTITLNLDSPDVREIDIHYFEVLVTVTNAIHLLATSSSQNYDSSYLKVAGLQPRFEHPNLLWMKG